MKERFEIVEKGVVYDPFPDGFGMEACDLLAMMQASLEPFLIPGPQHFGATMAPNGDLLVSFGNYLSDFRVGGEVWIIRSPDQGRTWELPRLLARPKKKDTSLFHALGMTTTSSGVILLPYAEKAALPWRYKKLREYRFIEETGEEFVRTTEIFLLKSTDNGYTWAEHQIPHQEWELFPYGKIIELRDGRLLFPCDGHHCRGEVYRAWVFKSFDDGDTWGDLTTIAVGDFSVTGYEGWNEPSLIELPDGKALAIIRPGARSVSSDGGDTWSAVERLKMTICCPCLHLSPAGALMLAYRSHDREEGTFALEIKWSEDEGRTWQGQLRVEDPKGLPPSRLTDGYPALVNLSDGRIFIVTRKIHQAHYGIYNILEERA